MQAPALPHYGEGTERVAQAQKRHQSNQYWGITNRGNQHFARIRKTLSALGGIDVRLHLVSGPNGGVIDESVASRRMDLVVGRLGVPKPCLAVVRSICILTSDVYGSTNSSIADKENFKISDIAITPYSTRPKGSITAPYVDRFLLSKALVTLTRYESTLSQTHLVKSLFVTTMRSGSFLVV